MRKRVPTKEQSLGNKMTPKMFNEWDSSKNTKSPFEIFAGSLDKTYWICSYCENEWGTPARSIKNGSGCPICSKYKKGDITKTHPELMPEWNSENGNPRQYGSGSMKIVKWDCVVCLNTWEATIPYKTRGAKCPYCENNKAIKGFNDLQTTHPDLLKEWDYDKNIIDPSSLTFKNVTKVWWKCEKGHNWEATINQRIIKKTNCSFCSNRKVLEGFNDLKSQYPFLEKEWDYKKNKNLLPSEIVFGSHIKVWWKCSKDHSWKATISHRSLDNSGCPYCSKLRTAIGENDIKTINPNYLTEWDYEKNNILPSSVTLNSSKKIWWKCKKGHSWQTAVSERTRGYSCPFCKNQKILKGFNDLKTLQPNLLKEWDYEKNNVFPDCVGQGAKQKAHWICSKNHEWESSIYHRVFNKSGCPNCYHFNSTSKREKELLKFIQEKLTKNKIVIFPNDRTLIHPYELDIYIPEKNIAIEFNGVYWHSEKAGKDNSYHYNKWKLCKEKGVQLITIWEDDWINKQDVIKSMLSHKLNSSQNDKVYARKTEISEIDYITARNFLDKNHIQGSMSGSKYISLKHENEIVAVSVWKKKDPFTVYLERYATSKIVVGGMGKLISYVQNNTYVNQNIVTFASHEVSNGKLYEDLGFIKDKEIPPDYAYVVNSARKHKFGYRKSKFEKDPNLLFDKNLTEKELAELNGLYRTWDCGKTRYILHPNRFS